MAKRSPLAQKLLDDLRLRKQQLGLSQDTHGQGQRQRSDTSGGSRWSSKGPPEVNPRKLDKKGTFSPGASDYTRNAAPKHGHQRAPTSDVSSTQIVPFQRGRESANTIDLSMAIALAFSKPGTRFSMELPGDGRGRGGVVLQRGIVDLRDKHGRIVSNEKWILSGQLPYLSDLQVGEIAKVAQNINLILHTCSDSKMFGSNSVEVGKRLLKGAKDLEESLRMLINLQEASQNMAKSKRKQIKLLKAEEEDESDHLKVDRTSREGDTSKFALDVLSRFNHLTTKKAVNIGKVEKKPSTRTSAVKHNLADSNITGNSPAHPKQLTRQQSASYDLVAPKPNVPSTNARNLNAYGEISRASQPKSKMNPERKPNVSVITQSAQNLHQEGPRENTTEKVRIPNVIAKLMGLELPQSPTETGTSAAPNFNKDVTATPNDGKLKMSAERHKEIQKYTLPVAITSLENHHKEIPQENSSMAPQASDGLQYRRDSIKNLVKQMNYIAVLEDPSKSHLNSQVVSANRERNQEARFRGKPSEKEESQYHKEIRENMTRNDQKPLPAYVSLKSQERFNQLVHLKNRMKEFPWTDKTMFLKKQTGTISSPEKSNPVKFTYGTIPKKLDQGKKQDFAQGNQNFRKDSNQIIDSETHQAKNGFQMIRPKKLGHKTNSGEILPSKQVGLPIKIISANALDKKQPKESAKENQIIGTNTTKRTVKNPRTEPANRAKPEQTATNVEQKGSKNKLKQIVQDASKQVKAEVVRNKDQDKPEYPKDKSMNMKKKLKETDKTVVEQQSQNKVIQRTERNSETCSCIPEFPTTNLDGLQQGMGSNSITANINIYDCENLTIEGPDAITEAKVENSSEIMKNDTPQHSIIIVKEDLEQKDASGCTSEGTINDEPCKNQDCRMQLNQTMLGLNITDHVDFNNDMKLTDSQKSFKDILLRSHWFAKAAQDIFQIDIHEDKMLECDGSYHDETSKLILDCGYEIMQRKAKIQETKVKIPLNQSVHIKQVTSLDNLITGLAFDLKSLNFSQQTTGDETNASEHLCKMLKQEIEDTKPDINCMWDFGWIRPAFAILEVGELVKNMEKCIYNELITEMVVEIF